MDSITKQNIMNQAQAGDRVVWTSSDAKTKKKKKVLYPGLGNRAGLHSYLREAIGDVWRSKGGEKLQGKLDALTEGSVAVEQFFNITRDLGRWLPAEIHEVTGPALSDRMHHRDVLYEQACSKIADLQRLRSKSRTKRGMGAFPYGW